MFSTSLFLVLLVAMVSALPTPVQVRGRRGSVCGLASNGTSLAASATLPLSSAISTSASVPSVSVSSLVASSSLASSAASSSVAPSSSASSAAPSSSTSAIVTAKSSSNNLISALFPAGEAGKSWSTADGADNQVDLSDSTFRQTNDIKQLPHPYEQKEGKSAMVVNYNQGTWGLKSATRGGVSFYAPGPQNVDLSTAKEATFGYSVYFQEGFQFNMGGKLPGLYGGNDAEGAIGCSGGSRNDACFSARLMWRTDGAGELYTYLPPSFPANDNVCDAPPQSHCNPEYGASVARGSFDFKAGEWTTISERVKLNDEGQKNGELELFVGGKSVVNVKGLVLRDSGAGRIRGIQMQSFFGGSGDEWASPQDQSIYYADFSVAITETL